MKHDVYDQGSTGTTTRPRQDEKSGGRQPELSKEEIQRRVEEAGRPGPGHKALEHYVGNWKAEVKCWMEPGGQPHVSHGSAQSKWAFNGRFLQEDFQGEMMGKPFRGQTLLGFDNVKQTYQSIWVSDTQTAIFVTEGRGDSKSITLEGKASCAATGRRDVPMKVVIRVISPDKHTFEMFDGSRGENSKSMEITYTRQ